MVSFINKKQELFIIFILLVLIFLPRVANLGLYLAHDEKMRNRESLDSFVAIAEGRWSDVYSSNFGGTNLTWARTAEKVIHCGWLRLHGVQVALPEMVKYGPQYNPLPGALFNALQIFIIYFFVRKLLGKPTAIVAVVLLALDPYLLSEARILRTEAAYAAFFTLASLSLALYAQRFQRRYLVWTAFWSAWFIATKVSGILISPIILVVLAWVIWQHRPAGEGTGWVVKRLLVDSLLAGALTLVIIVLIWPTWWSNQWQTLVTYYEYLKFFAVTSKEDLTFFYAGKIVADLPPSYYGWVLLYKTTPLVWLGLIAFAVAWWRKKMKNGGIILFAAVVFIALMTISTFKTERYMMSAVSNLDVVAALGLVSLIGWSYRRWTLTQRPAPVFAGLVLLVFFVGHGLFTCLNHPYYFSYYNSLLGGGKTASQILQIGSGELLDRAMAFVNRQPDPASQEVVCGTNLPRCEYLSAGQTMLKREELLPVHSNWVGANYVVDYIFHRQRQDYPAGVMNYLENHVGRETTIQFQGIDYARVYRAPKFNHVVAARLTGVATLLGYNLDKTTAVPGDSLQFDFLWQNDGQIKEDMFLRLTDPDDYTWATVNVPVLPEFEQYRSERNTVLAGKAVLPVPADIPPGRYYLQMGYRRGNGELVGLFTLPAGSDAITVERAVEAPASAFTGEPLLKLNDELLLADTKLSASQASPGEAVWLVLFWQTKADVKTDYVLNLQLLSPEGREIAYWLGRPIRSVLPTNQWLSGEKFQDPWLLIMPDSLPPGSYQLALTVYDAATSQPVVTTTLQAIIVP